MNIGDKVQYRPGTAGTIVRIEETRAEVYVPVYGHTLWVDAERLKPMPESKLRELLDDFLVRVETIWEDVTTWRRPSLNAKKPPPRTVVVPRGGFFGLFR